MACASCWPTVNSSSRPRPAAAAAPDAPSRSDRTPRSGAAQAVILVYRAAAQNGGSCGLCCSRLVAPHAVPLGAGDLRRRLAGFSAARRNNRGLPKCLSCCASDIRGDDVSGVSVQGHPGPVVAHRGPRIGVRSRFLHVPQRHPASSAAVMKACRSVCGPMGLVIPARRATGGRSGRHRGGPADGRPAARKIGPSQRSPMARSIARAVRGASGMVTTLPPLRVITRVRCPRSNLGPRCSRRSPRRPVARSAPAARSGRARQAGRALRRPAARRVRCGRVRWRATHNPGGDDGHERPGEWPRSSSSTA